MACGRCGGTDVCCRAQPQAPLPRPRHAGGAARHSPEGALQRKEHSKSTPGGMPNSSRTCCRNCSMPSGPGRTRILTNWPLSDTTMTGSTGCGGLGAATDLEQAMAARQSGRLPLQNLQLLSSCGFQVADGVVGYVGAGLRCRVRERGAAGCATAPRVTGKTPANHGFAKAATQYVSY